MAKVMGAKTKTVPRCPMALAHLAWKGVQSLELPAHTCPQQSQEKGQGPGCCAMTPSLAQSLFPAALACVSLPHLHVRHQGWMAEEPMNEQTPSLC